MGTGTCSSSNCHGSERPVDRYDIMQNEFFSWQKKDKHSQAYQVLLNDESKKIAHHLGIAAAEKEPLCLKCHSTYVPDEKLHGQKFTLEDGVSCEACHGAAEHWLESHTANDASHEKNVEKGLREFVSVETRASFCLTCHFGTEDKTVDHRLIGAGHPRLRFELDTYGTIQPRHWDVDDDYRKRKGNYEPAKAWLVGQVTQSSEIVGKLLSPKRSAAGAWPELTLFNCYACHHDLTEDQWKKREYHGRPGELRLNLSSLHIVHEALMVLDAKLAADLGAKITALEKGFQSSKGGKDEASALKSLINGGVRALSTRQNLDDATLDKLLVRLLDFGAGAHSASYEVAEQVAMGVTSILAQRSPSTRAHQDQVNSLFQSLGNADQFKPEVFTKACADFRKKV